MQRWLFSVLVIAVLAACAELPAVPPAAPQTFLHDNSFASPAQPVDAREVFALDDSMRDYLRQGAAPLLRREGRAKGLVDALYARGEL